MSWARTADASGWGRPDRARATHWFERGTSLCGRWTLEDWAFVVADHVQRWSNDCRRCERLRERRREVEAAHVDALLEDRRRLLAEVEARGRLLDSYEVRLRAYRDRAAAAARELGAERVPPDWWTASAGAWAELVPVGWEWDA